MPFARISLREGKSATYVRTLADRIHQALVEGFDTPLADRFQQISLCRPEELIYDENYMGGPRSDDFVLISITAGRPRPPAVKKAFYERLVSLLGDSPGLRPEDIMVIIDTTQSDEWSFGSGRSIIAEE